MAHRDTKKKQPSSQARGGPSDAAASPMWATARLAELFVWQLMTGAAGLTVGVYTVDLLLGCRQTVLHTHATCHSVNLSALT